MHGRLCWLGCHGLEGQERHLKTCISCPWCQCHSSSIIKQSIKQAGEALHCFNWQRWYSFDRWSSPGLYCIVFVLYWPMTGSINLSHLPSGFSWPALPCVAQHGGDNALHGLGLAPLLCFSCCTMHPRSWLDDICAGKGGVRCCVWPSAYTFREARFGDMHSRLPAELDDIWVPPASLLGLTKSHIFLL